MTWLRKDLNFAQITLPLPSKVEVALQCRCLSQGFIQSDNISHPFSLDILESTLRISVQRLKESSNITWPNDSVCTKNISFGKLYYNESIFNRIRLYKQESMGIVQFAVHVFFRAGGELDWLVYYKTLGFNSQEFKIIQCVHADFMSRRGNSCHRKLPLFTFKNHSYHQWAVCTCQKV